MFLADCHPACPTNSLGQPVILEGPTAVPWKQQLLVQVGCLRVVRAWAGGIGAPTRVCEWFGQTVFTRRFLHPLQTRLRLSKCRPIRDQVLTCLG